VKVLVKTIGRKPHQTKNECMYVYMYALVKDHWEEAPLTKRKRWFVVATVVRRGHNKKRGFVEAAVVRRGHTIRNGGS